VRERVELARLNAVGAVRQGNDLDREVEVVRAMGDHPVDAGDHLGHVHGAVGGPDLHRDDLRAGSDAVELVLLGDAPAADDAGQVRAVAVPVQVPLGRVLAVEVRSGQRR
jgi:hypothetical protein